MYFNKKLVPLAVAAATFSFAGQLSAEEATITPYGKINITLQQTDDGLDGMELKSNASRFGFKGKAKLSDSLKAIYQLEWEVDVADKSKGSEDNIKARNQFVGLAGNFGELIAGRSDTPLKKAQGKVDLFNDLEADIKHIFEGEVRANNLVQYTTPKFAGGFKVKVASTTAGTGSETNSEDFGSATSFAIEYATDNLFVALAQDSDVAASDTKTTRVTTQYKLDNWSFGAIYSEFDNGSFDEEGLLVSVAYHSGNHTFKFQTGESDEKVFDAKQVSLGYDYKLGKSTKMFLFHTSYEDQTGADNSWLGFGIEQKF
jgi:predicted porin